MARVREFDTTTAIQQAMDLFWRQGYESTSMEDLTAALGLGRGSIYAAFGNKSGLYQAAIAHYRNTMVSDMLAALASSHDITEAVRAMLIGRLEVATADPNRLGCMLVNATAERVPADPDTSRVVRDVLAASRSALAEALTAAIADGQISSTFDPDTLAQFLMTCMNGLLIAAKVEPDLAALTAVVDVALAALG